MLRPSPTIISLSKRDVREHFENISRRATTSRCHKVTQPASAKSPFQRDFNLQKDFTGDLQVSSWNPQDIHYPRRRISEEVVGDQSNSLDDSPESRFSNSTDTEETSQMMTSNLLSRPNLLPTSRFSSYENEDGHLVTGIPSLNDNANEGLGPTEPLSFQDSGSRWHLTPQESALDNDRLLERPSRDSSSFVPDDVSTPQETRLPTLQRLRARNPLPRSPLFRSYNARSSPDGIRSVGLAPHLLSPGSPGVLFSRPARRSRDYRFRTSALSLGEPKKTSASLEDLDVSELDPLVGPSLHTERIQLYDGSGESSDGESSHSSFPPDHIFHANGATRPRGEMASEYARSSGLSSHSLHLPPPFSASSRSGSAAGSLLDELSGSSGLSPRTLPRGDVSSRCAVLPGLANLDNTPGSKRVQQSLSPASVSRSVLSVPLRLISAYRSRSPIGPRHLSPWASVTPERVSTNGRMTSSAPPPAPTNTPYRRLQVYDDGLPASLQPQTPQNLLEARHQSHHHPSYTAPVWRHHGGAQQTRGGTYRRWGRRSGSPIGLDTPGFAGLYGGQENTDDEVMFDRAAQRLFLQREGGREFNRSVSDTRESETSFS